MIVWVKCEFASKNMRGNEADREDEFCIRMAVRMCECECECKCECVFKCIKSYSFGFFLLDFIFSHYIIIMYIYTRIKKQKKSLYEKNNYNFHATTLQEGNVSKCFLQNYNANRWQSTTECKNVASYLRLDQFWWISLPPFLKFRHRAQKHKLLCLTQVHERKPS